MRAVHTHTPPLVRSTGGGFEVEVSVSIDGELYIIHAAAGDGRYLAEQVFAQIIAPAIAPRGVSRRARK